SEPRHDPYRAIAAFILEAQLKHTSKVQSLHIPIPKGLPRLRHNGKHNLFRIKEPRHMTVITLLCNLICHPRHPGHVVNLDLDIHDLDLVSLRAERIYDLRVRKRSLEAQDTSD